MSSIKKIFQKYISDRFPKKQTNIFWQIFNGVQEALSYLETLILIYKRERNILTATTLISLRNLAAQNGFEPKLKEPSKGVVSIKVDSKLFNRVGYPLYLPPYSIFKNKMNNLTYYFDSNTSLKIENDIVYVPLVEGEIISKTFTSGGNYIERIFIDTDSVANGSISISVGTQKYTEVKSFFDNNNLFDNEQFLVKFSNKPDTPLVIYIKKTKLSDIINVSYRVTSGEFGNITYNTVFETEAILNSLGEVIDISDDEIRIHNESGFSFGSNGSDINTLKAAIGYNHDVTLLFDTVSYTDYILRYSNVLLQNIILSENEKSINNIFVSKRQYINESLTNFIKEQYVKIISSKSYLLNDEDFKTFDDLITENEFALSSHNLFHSQTNKFALQILFNTQVELEQYQKDISDLIYIQFGKFLYDKYHIINLELLFNEFMVAKKIDFEYTLFNDDIERQKILESKEISTPYIISHIDKLPILCGDFNVIGTINDDTIMEPFKLFFDINIVSKENI